jgi:hypothetical protein
MEMTFADVLLQVDSDAPEMAEKKPSWTQRVS